MKPTIQFLPYRPAVAGDRPTTLQLLVRITPPPAGRSKIRPDLNLGLSIDRSGSMNGTPLEHARRAGCNLIEQLAPQDTVSVVAFDDQVQVLSTCVPAGDTGMCADRIRKLTAGGSTALHQGWLEACHQVEKGVTERRLSRVLLLTDGQANVGITSPDRISAQVAEWLSKGISTTTVGLGEHYDEDLLSQMSRAGGGSFYHITRPEEIDSLFQVEMAAMMRTFGLCVSLGVEGRNGVELLRVVNPLDRTAEGRLKLADLVHGYPIDVVMEFMVPAMDRERDLLTARLAWTDLGNNNRRHVEIPFRLPVVPYGQLTEFPLCQEVAVKRALQLSADFLKRATRLLEGRDIEGAKLVVNEGLMTLREAGPSDILEDQIGRLEEMRRDLERGRHSVVRKQAMSRSLVTSMGSVALSGGISKFMKLPPEERTQERLKKFLEEEFGT